MRLVVIIKVIIQAPLVDDAIMEFFVQRHLFMSFHFIYAAIARKVKAFLFWQPWYLSQQLVLLGSFDKGVMGGGESNHGCSPSRHPQTSPISTKDAAFHHWHTANSWFYLGLICLTWPLAGIPSIGHWWRLAGLATSRMASWSVLRGDGCHHWRLCGCEWHSWEVH